MIYIYIYIYQGRRVQNFNCFDIDENQLGHLNPHSFSCGVNNGSHESYKLFFELKGSHNFFFKALAVCATIAARGVSLVEVPAAVSYSEACKTLGKKYLGSFAKKLARNGHLLTVLRLKSQFVSLHRVIPR